MKTLVIYNSQTGFTKQYAEWISEAVGGSSVTLKQASDMDLSVYDAVVFGSWIHAGRVQKLNWFQEKKAGLSKQKKIVYVVGASPAGSPDSQNNMKNNFPQKDWGDVATFYCPGGLCYEKMNGRSKFMMKMLCKIMDSKKDKTEDEQVMANQIRNSYDESDKSYIEPILECLK